MDWACNTLFTNEATFINFLKIFHGLRLFGGLRLLFFEKVPRATLIWGATTIWQVRVSDLEQKDA